ncbi:MAG: hypothetical protein ACE5EX_01390 [Phycisphaerae bacterium]
MLSRMVRGVGCGVIAVVAASFTGMSEARAERGRVVYGYGRPAARAVVEYRDAVPLAVRRSEFVVYSEPFYAAEPVYYGAAVYDDVPLVGRYKRRAYRYAARRGYRRGRYVRGGVSLSFGGHRGSRIGFDFGYRSGRRLHRGRYGRVVRRGLHRLGRRLRRGLGHVRYRRYGHGHYGGFDYGYYGGFGHDHHGGGWSFRF